MANFNDLCTEQRDKVIRYACDRTMSAKREGKSPSDFLPQLKRDITCFISKEKYFSPTPEQRKAYENNPALADKAIETIAQRAEQSTLKESLALAQQLLGSR